MFLLGAEDCVARNSVDLPRDAECVCYSAPWVNCRRHPSPPVGLKLLSRLPMLVLITSLVERVFHFGV